MAFRLAALVHRVAPALTRAVVSEAAPSLKARLRTDVLASLKGGASERWRATVAKSVIAEITTAEKSATSSKAINENAIAMRCINRRLEAESQFRAASRSDLADQEKREAEYLQAFLPPQLTETEVDTILSMAHSELSQPIKLGSLMKAFYVKASNASVDNGLVRKRAAHLLGEGTVQ